ncbi:MAG TPA: hypothetical protein VHI13_08885 [Candidatus Kapabacteria bacterium]|nr:hypothetical protein [Candidatus Kapabacteria bacterium]
MSTVNKQLSSTGAPQVLPNVVAAFYTTPGGTVALIKKATFVNTANTAVVITGYFVPAAGNPGATNIAFGPVTVPAKPAIPGLANPILEVYEIENHTLMPGMSLQLVADTVNAVVGIVSGLEITQ